MADVNLGGLEGSFGGFNLGRIAAQQRAEAALKEKLGALQDIEKIRNASMENEVMGASLEDLKAKQGITNRYNESMTRSLDASTRDKEFDLGVKQGLGQEFYQQQAQGDESDKKLKRMQKMGGLLSSVGAAMASAPPEAQPMAFENVAGMAGFPAGFVQQVKSGYKGDKPFAQYIQEMGERFANASPEELSKKNDDMRREATQLKGIRAQGEEARKTQQQAIDAGKYNKSSRSAQDQIEKALLSGNYVAVASTYDFMAQQAAREGDREGALYYAEKSKEYVQRDLDRQGTAANARAATQVDLTKLDIPTVGQQPPPKAPMLPGSQQSPAQQASGPKPLYATNPKTGQRIMSSDGGKTWQQAQ